MLGLTGESGRLAWEIQMRKYFNLGMMYFCLAVEYSCAIQTDLSGTLLNALCVWLWVLIIKNQQDREEILRLFDKATFMYNKATEETNLVYLDRVRDCGTIQ